VVAYALAGTMDLDLTTEPLGTDTSGQAVYLRDIWPTEQEVADAVREAVTSEMFRTRYASVFTGDERWSQMAVAGGDTFAWDPTSTYVLRPPFFAGLGHEPAPLDDIIGARVLALLGDSVTTDHISPAGSIRLSSPAENYLTDHGVDRRDFNSYGARRGNHEVMVRGTFANVRLRNLLVPGTEGGVTRHLPDGEQMSVYEAAMRYQAEGVPLVVLAGGEYGSGSSRDWAAKGPALLGVRAVVAESFERIHRSNLLGMGILPLQFEEGQSVASLGLTGEEQVDVRGLGASSEREGEVPKEVTVRADDVEFTARVRIDTPMEAEYFRHGGILPYVLRRLAS
jgi:aconitate hydratase